MLRVLSRLHVQRHELIRPVVQFYSGNFQSSSLQTKNAKNPNNGNDKQWPSLNRYFETSDRHKSFRKDPTILYQFDEETKAVVQYDDVQAHKDIDWNQSTANFNNTELINAFDALLNHCRTNNVQLSDEQFDEFVDGFVQRLPDFNVNELIRALQIFVRNPLDRNQLRQRNWIEVFQAFDQACCIKTDGLLPEQLVFMSSIWLDIDSAKRSWFPLLLSRHLNRYLRTMSAPDLALALFYMNSKALPINDIRAFENIFEEKIEDLTLEEFAVVVWTFIRLETKLEKQELRNKFFDYLEKQDFHRLPDAYLSKILIVSKMCILIQLRASLASTPGVTTA